MPHFLFDMQALEQWCHSHCCIPECFHFLCFLSLALALFQLRVLCILWFWRAIWPYLFLNASVFRLLLYIIKKGGNSYHDPATLLEWFLHVWQGASSVAAVALQWPNFSRRQGETCFFFFFFLQLLQLHWSRRRCFFFEGLKKTLLGAAPSCIGPSGEPPSIRGG